MVNPCHFYSKDFELKGIVHGDDFLFTGTAAQLEWLRQKFEKEYETKIEVIGYGPNIANSARFLNRVITFGKEGIEFEPDQRLVEAMIDGLGLKGSSAVTTPGTKPKPVPRSQQQMMMERRLSAEDGQNCVIANLKSQIGQLDKVLQEAIEARTGTKVERKDIQEWLESLPNPNHNDGAKFQKSAVGSRDLDENLDTNHQGATDEKHSP